MSGSLNITADDLKEMIATAVSTAIQESRKPAPPTEAELAELKLKQEHRLLNSQDVVSTAENKKNFQRICAHEHSKKDGGHTHGVWIREEDPTSPGYIYCQKCEAKIRPASPLQGTKREDRTAIYDTELFNRMFQDCGEQALMG